jgi:hypothetical protein
MWAPIDARLGWFNRASTLAALKSNMNARAAVAAASLAQVF